MPNKKNRSRAQHNDLGLQQRSVIDYFKYLSNRPLTDFEKYWKNLRSFKKAKHFSLSQIPVDIGDQILNHPDGREAQEKAISFMVERFEIFATLFAKRNQPRTNRVIKILKNIAFLATQFPNIDFSKTYELIRDKIDMNSFSRFEKSQIAQYDIWFRKKATVKNDSAISQKPKHKETQRLKKYFHAAGVPVNSLNESPAYPLTFSDAFWIGNDKKILVEFDSYEETRLLNGAPEGLSKHRQIRSSTISSIRPDLTVLRINYIVAAHLDDLATQDAKTETQNVFIRKLFELASDASPGVYVASLEAPYIKKIAPVESSKPTEEIGDKPANDNSTHAAPTGAERFKNKFGGLGF